MDRFEVSIREAIYNATAKAGYLQDGMLPDDMDEAVTHFSENDRRRVYDLIEADYWGNDVDEGEW